VRERRTEDINADITSRHIGIMKAHKFTWEEAAERDERKAEEQVLGSTNI
jgi:hypothetical protein